MTRYFVTIPEAVRLILHAGAIGKPGDIHVLNMGQPIRIVDLARDLIRLSWPAGERDIAIVFTGLRPGEKLEEALFGADETAVSANSPALMIARPSAEGSLQGRATSLASLRSLPPQGKTTSCVGRSPASASPRHDG